MFKPADLHEYQRKAIVHQITRPLSMLWLDMGLGKTVCTLTSIEHRIRSGQIKKTLVFGPLRVIHSVWEKQAREWEHTRHLRFSLIHGTEKKRQRKLFEEADVYLCNYENMAWLSNQLMHYYLKQGKPLPFQMVVYDEISKLKDAQSQRMNGGRRVTKKKIIEMLPLAGSLTYQQFRERGWTDAQLRRQGYANITPEEYISFSGWKKIVEHVQFATGLTGTPAPNGYYDLHGQYLAVDGGQRLGRTVTEFRERFCESDYMGWSYAVNETSQRRIEERIFDITIKMDAEDYLDMPDLIVNNIMVDLSESVMTKYREVEEDLFTVLDDGTEIELFSQSSVSNKALQFCVAEGTDVLTDNGWKKIETVVNTDKVWDGVEWVNVDGLVCNGYKKVIDCGGVDMTPDHKVLTVTGWAEAKDTIYGNAGDRLDRAGVRLPYGFEEGGFYNRENKESALADEMFMRERGFDSPCGVKKVYDLINAGSRHRFTVRGRTGEVFIVHNCNGSPYKEPGSKDYSALHNIKLDALEDILEEAAGQPVLLAYSFRSDAERIMKRFNRKDFRVVNMTDEKASKTDQIIKDFNEGRIQLLIGHPASMGHGVDGLQKTCHILVWFGINWSLELYEQMYKRLYRQGQSKPVIMHHILCNNTIDLAVADAIRRKDDTQKGLKRAIDRYRNGVIPKDGQLTFLDVA